jgi:hypothetical protein
MRAETTQDARDFISAGRKNLIINGNPIVYQRAQTATNVANYQYHTADRWRLSQFGVNAGNDRVTNMSVVTNADIAGDFIGNYVRIDHTTAATNPASNASVGYNYRIEPRDIVPYLGKEMTLSFYARSNAGIAINSSFVGGTTPSSIVLINSNDSSTWVTLTSDWKRYKFTFTLGTTVPSTYVDIAIRHQPGIFGHVDMTGIQLERGRNATEFEHRSYGEELALCQRYFFVYDSGRFITTSNGSSIIAGNIFYPVTMRANPTITYYGGNSTTGNIIFFSAGSGTQTNYNVTANNLSTAFNSKNILGFNSTSISIPNGYSAWVDLGTGSNHLKITGSAEL